MERKETVEVEGGILASLPKSMFPIECSRRRASSEIPNAVHGKMQKQRIRTLSEEKILLEMIPYDLKKGRITLRHK